MVEYCKVCGIKLSSNNTVDYRPGSCRDCELERKKLYSGISIEIGKKGISKTKSKRSIKKVKTTKLKGGRKPKKAKKYTKQLIKLKKQKREKAKKLAKLRKIREQREKKREKIRARIEKLRKLRAQKLLKLKVLKKKQKERERRERERIRFRIKKAKERERKLLRKERERLKKEKEKLRQLVRQEKDRIRQAKKQEKDRIRQEKQRLRQERQKEKERLKKSKEAAKFAIIQARESARKAAQEARRLREEAKKPPIVSMVTKVKEFQPPPDVKVIGATPRQQVAKTPQTKKKDDLAKKLSIADAVLLESATVIPAKGEKEEKDILKQTAGAQKTEKLQKEIEKLKKDTDPIIDRYNPYAEGAASSGSPRPPSPTPWLAPSFKVVGGDFKETQPGESGGTQGGLTEDQVKEIIEKVKQEHKKKSP